MAKKSTEVATVPQSDRPQWLANPDTGARGVSELSQFVKPPRLKVVQTGSDRELTAQFEPGSVILMPQRVELALMPKGEEEGPAFKVVNLLFYPEWVAWNPLEAKGQLNSIRERSQDPKSQLAALCQSPATWAAVCPEFPSKNIRYCEHLNFIQVITDESHPMYLQPYVVSFSRASHKHGSALAGLIKMRKADIFGCQFEMLSRYEKNTKGQWFALRGRNPDNGSQWVQDKSLYDTLEAMHTELYDAQKKGRLVTDYEEDEPAEGGTDVPAEGSRRM